MDNLNVVVKKYIKQHLSPKTAEQKDISKKYSDLDDILVGNIFQSGSYARFTSISPVNDLDVVWELPNEVLRQNFPEIFAAKKIIYPQHLDVHGIIDDLALKLKKEYKGEVRIKPQTHSVGIYFGVSDEDFSIDIVPAIPIQEKNEYGEQLYLIPEIGKLSKTKRVKRYADKSNKISWIKTDPRGYIKAAQIINEKNDNFRKTTKFIKTWKRNCKVENDDFKLKSFHIEQIIFDIIENDPKLECYDIISSFYFQFTARLLAPSIPDRGNPATKIDEYLTGLTDAQKKANKDQISKALSTIDEIEGVEEETRIVGLIEKLLQKDNSKKEDVDIPRATKPISRPYYGL